MHIFPSSSMKCYLKLKTQVWPLIGLKTQIFQHCRPPIKNGQNIPTGHFLWRYVSGKQLSVIKVIIFLTVIGCIFLTVIWASAKCYTIVLNCNKIMNYLILKKKLCRVGWLPMQSKHCLFGCQILELVLTIVQRDLWVMTNIPRVIRYNLAVESTYVTCNHSRLTSYE